MIYKNYRAEISYYFLIFFVAIYHLIGLTTHYDIVDRHIQFSTTFHSVLNKNNIAQPLTSQADAIVMSSK